MQLGTTRALSLAGAAVLLLSACGASTSQSEERDAGSQTTEAEQVYAELSSLTGQERRDELVRRAEEEGQLSVYTAMNTDIADAVSEAFQDTFDIELSMYRAASEMVLQRLLQEDSAGFAGADVVECSAPELQAANQEGLLAEYAGERRDLVPEAGQGENWTATYFNIFVPSWNTNLIDELGGPPQSWEDLADPKYDGTLAMEVSDYDWYLTLYGYWQEQGKSDAEIDQIFTDMAAGAKVVKGHTVMVERLSAGQYALAASPYSYAVDRAKLEGVPVEYQPAVEPVISRGTGLGLMKSAQHPAAAMLFTDWMLEEGQSIIEDEGLTPSVGHGGEPFEGLEVIPVDLDTLLSEGEEWSARYDELLAAAE